MGKTVVWVSLLGCSTRQLVSPKWVTPRTKIDVDYTDKPVHSEYLLIEQMCAWHYAKRFTNTILFNPDNSPWTIVLICADKTEAFKSEATCSTKLLGGRARV